MQNTKNKKSSGKCDDLSSVRVYERSIKKADGILEKANKKKFGRKIKFYDVVDLALGLVTESHIETLQRGSMTFANRQEELRQKYIEKRGWISEDGFIGFMMSCDFQDFLREQSNSEVSPSSEEGAVA